MARSGHMTIVNGKTAYSVGELVAEAHQIETALGDTKPENFIVDSKGEVTLVDLEQARHRGDYSWDVAEFLFYSGHYWLLYNQSLGDYVDSFLEGYLSKNSRNILHKAGSPKYLRIFSVWTPPNVILNIRKKLMTS
jgi:tRNA A-37 threonylcarbamoyl transferase component Bud32